MASNKLTRRQREQGLTTGPRSPNAFDKAQLRRLCAGHTDEAVATLLRLMADGDNPAVQLKAVELLLRWGYGGPEVRAGERLPGQAEQVQGGSSLEDQIMLHRLALDTLEAKLRWEQVVDVTEDESDD